MNEHEHKRFLEYRERSVYFEKETRARLLLREEFVAADTERRALVAKGERRDDEEDARFVELSKMLFLD